MNEIARQIIDTIDFDRAPIGFDNIHDLTTVEFDGIYGNVWQVQHRLGSRRFHTWTCTDTEVGIHVWYFDEVPVCISSQKYRKGTKMFFWLSKEAYKEVKKYIESLQDDDEVIRFNSFEDMPDIITMSDKVDHKKFESKNIKQ